MATIKVFGTTKDIVQLPLSVKMKNEVSAVAIGNIDVSVTGNSRFGRFKFFSLGNLIFWYLKFTNYPPIKVKINYPTVGTIGYPDGLSLSFPCLYCRAGGLWRR